MKLKTGSWEFFQVKAMEIGYVSTISSNGIVKLSTLAYKQDGNNVYHCRAILKFCDLWRFHLQYWPKLGDAVSGSNYMEKWAQTLYVLIKGTDPIEIRVSDVVIVSFDLDPVPGK